MCRGCSRDAVEPRRTFEHLIDLAQIDLPTRGKIDLRKIDEGTSAQSRYSNPIGCPPKKG